MKLLLLSLPLLVLFASMVATVSVLWWWRRRLALHPRRSPLTRDLLRPPGTHLQQRIQDLQFDLTMWLACMLLSPLVTYSLHITTSYFEGEKESIPRTVINVVIGLGFMTFIAKKLYRTMADLQQHRLGLDGELATAEELNQLMLVGCRVFHDIPIDYGNIDHVVVSLSGVFIVETKMRGKPVGHDNAARVIVDDKYLRYPDVTTPLPMSQIETQTRWLSLHLASSVGESVPVEGMLALPGWYIDRQAKSGLFVFNPRNCQKFFVLKRQVLSPKLVQQVAHQLEQLCRDIEPTQKLNEP